MMLTRLLCVVVTLLAVLSLSTKPVVAKPFELNDDGRHLIQQSRQTYDSDMRDRPVNTDQAVNQYVQSIAHRVLAGNKALPAGVQVSVTVLDSPEPELYTYIDGHLVVTTGLIFGLDNEAQLGGLIAPQIAHLAEGYYLALYQKIKAAERRQVYKEVAGHLFGALLDAAVDYAVNFQTIEMTEEIMTGEATYSRTMKRLAAMEAGQQAYFGIKEVISNVPTRDDKGKAMDPRLQFEPIADAQGLIYTARAGYDPAESIRGCNNILSIKHRLLKAEQQMMGAFAKQLRAQRSLMESNLMRLRQQMGTSGLVQTSSHMPPSRPQFLASLMNLKELQEVKVRGQLTNGRKPYRAFLQRVLLPRAQEALARERYEDAHRNFVLLYERGVHTAPVAYGLAKSQLGDFAFGASPAEVRAAEKAYREALRLDPSFAEPHRGLAELYSDTDDYEAAIEHWQTYLKLAPKGINRRKIERKIKRLKRKASR